MLSRLSHGAVQSLRDVDSMNSSCSHPRSRECQIAMFVADHSVALKWISGRLIVLASASKGAKHDRLVDRAEWHCM